jgi:short-subunit dehydrogenase
MGSGETGTGQNPPCGESINGPVDTNMPSPSEVLQSFSALVLTGGSSGIGRSFIELGASLEPNLVFCNLSRRLPAKKTCEIAGKRLNHFACDVSRPEELARVAGELSAFLATAVPAGRILLVNNSGFGAFGRFPEPGLDRQLELIDVNVRAVVELTGRLLPILRARGGAILNIASTVAFQPTAFAATYGASKAFVLHWTLALNEELRGSGVRALALCPGTTTTEFFRTAGLADGAVVAAISQSPETVVACALRALGSGRSQVVPGWFNKLYTLVGARLPKPLATRLAALVFGRFRLGRTSP